MNPATLATAAPTPLDVELRRAEELAKALADALDRTPHEAVAIVWLAGRADEVLAVARGIVRDWAAGRLGTIPAAMILRDYTEGLRRTLAQWVADDEPAAQTRTTST